MTGAQAWIDGKLVPVNEARVSAFDHGLTVGNGVFETLKTVQGEAFALRRHLERLDRSAAALGLEAPPHKLLRDAVAAVIDANGTDPMRVRITVTGGQAPLGSQRGKAAPTVVVASSPLSEHEATAAVVTVGWRRNEKGALAGLKTTSYGENVRALAAAHERGADEAILANTADELCEGTGSNVFVVVDGRLCTPPLWSGCLAGVTRGLVIALTGAAEVTLPYESLTLADEAFLTSTTRDVQAIGEVDGIALPAAPGPQTVAASEAFARLVEGDLDP